MLNTAQCCGYPTNTLCSLYYNAKQKQYEC